MKLRAVTLYHTRMTLKAPFVTSFGAVHERDGILVEVKDAEGLSGWGECVAFAFPWYTEETIETCRHMLVDFLIPLLRQKVISRPSEVFPLFSGIRRNYMAKAAIECAIWDLYAKQRNEPLAHALGGVRPAIEVGVSLGIAPISQLLQQIEDYLAAGYKRVKVKIKPGFDVQALREIRRHFPDIALQADANSAYTLDDLPLLQALDEFQLLMIEQPLAADDIIQHATLQRKLATPVCLDESIVTCEDAENAIALGSCRVINVKLGRVGGFAQAKRIHDLCRAHGIAVWCGGMLETGIGRAHNIALASLAQFTLPGDISASSRYWEQDIIVPEVIVQNGTIRVPDTPGIGYSVDGERLQRATVHRETIKW
ncbi:MAG TPA: o-succinylbenzoate synthase [Bacilli bacterium]